MGNQLIGIAPAQIFPVEYYINDVEDLEFESSLGSTRFFKVALARYSSGGGLLVVKVFTGQEDVPLTLKFHEKKLSDLKRKLEGSVNCLPFQKFFWTDKSALIIRQHVMYSLYDLISTRPFLSVVEKKWISFQLLLALQQAHRNGVCHGDIKLENVLVTSWKWVFISDFASFKPTFLPEDNPSYYSFFFDTSRRRTCYIAPERFKSATADDNQLRGTTISPRNSPRCFSTNDSCSLSGNFSDKNINFAADNAELLVAGGDELVPSMDLFSAGCTILELFTDGTTPFTFSELLAYRNGEYRLDKILSNIDVPYIGSLLGHMLQLDPMLRLTASEYLANEKGRSFPHYFYSFMQSYMQLFSTDTTITADQKMFRISGDIDSIIEMVEKEEDGIDSEGLLLVTVLVTSNFRSLIFCDAKLNALDVLTKLSYRVSNAAILERILPHLVFMMGDKESRVRIAAMWATVSSIKNVSGPSSSSERPNIFPEFILPALLPLCHDKNFIVRTELAKAIAQIAEESVRFLDSANRAATTANSADKTGPTEWFSSYETELATLHDLVAQAVSILMTDPVNCVKQALLQDSVCRLAVFFGKVKANDILLSHMITFLNDKDDSGLKKAFYKNVVGVAAFVGWKCSPILLPLLEQGLCDLDEFTIVECITAMTSFAHLGILSHVTLYQLLHETAPFLLHPNLWLRHAAVGFISFSARLLDAIDVLVKLGGIVKRYLQKSVIMLDLPELLMDNLITPIPRNIFEAVVGCSGSPTLLLNFLSYLKKRHFFSTTKDVATLEPGVLLLFHRLKSDGLNTDVEYKLVLMKDVLLKLNKLQLSSTSNIVQHETGISALILNTVSITKFTAADFDITHGVKIIPKGRLDLAITSNSAAQHRRMAWLANEEDDDVCQSVSTATVTSINPLLMETVHSLSGVSPHVSVKSAAILRLEEWQHMFGPSKSGSTNDSLTIQHSDWFSDEVESEIEVNSFTVSSGSIQSSTLLSKSISSNNQDKDDLVAKCENSMLYGDGGGNLFFNISYQDEVLSSTRLTEKHHQDTQGITAYCRTEMDQFFAKQKAKTILRNRKDSILNYCSAPANSPPFKWRPKGILVSHLYEHKEAVVRLVRLPGQSVFACAAADGKIRFWDCTKLEGANIANKPSRIYGQHNGSSLTDISVCGFTDHMASAAEDGSLAVCKIGNSTNTGLTRRMLSLTEEGPAISLSFLETGLGRPVLVYATAYGPIVGWDLRQSRNAFTFDIDLSKGIPTCMAVSSDQTWLITGSENGYFNCWDLRFGLPLISWQHPTKSRIRYLHIPNNKNVATDNHGNFWASLEVNNEVCLWNVENKSRSRALWASPNVPLSNAQSFGQRVLSCKWLPNADVMLTGGSDMRIRLWDIQRPRHSYVIAWAVGENHCDFTTTFRSKVVDGTISLIQEFNIRNSKNTLNREQFGGVSGSNCTDNATAWIAGATAGIAEPEIGHHNWITDIIVCPGHLGWYVVSGSRDGTVKIWK